MKSPSGCSTHIPCHTTRGRHIFYSAATGWGDVLEPGYPLALFRITDTSIKQETFLSGITVGFRADGFYFLKFIYFVLTSVSSA